MDFAASLRRQVLNFLTANPRFPPLTLITSRMDTIITTISQKNHNTEDSS